jgi:diguanylate cyclase (GGDEF)-like protein/PAS domain S-box-containing protein
MTQKKKPLAVEVELQQRQEELELINKELVQSQMKLEVAYRQYADLYNFAPVGYLTLTRNGAIHQVNLAGANLLGVNHNEATQVRLAAFISSESRPAFDVFFEKLLSGEGKESCELVLNERGDWLLWVRLEATCFEGGQVSRAILVDITERKQAEELLKESEWRTRIVSELTTDYIFVVDVNPNGILKLRWASDNLSRMTGRTIEEVGTSDKWGSIIHPDDKGRFFEFLNQILSTAKAGEFECRSFYKHGGERWIWIFVRPQVGEENRVTTIVGAIQDITERKRAEEALKRNERVLRLFVQHSPASIAMFDLDMKYIVASRRYLVDYGLGEQDLTGRSHYEVFPEISEHWKEIYRRCLAGAIEKADEDPFPRTDGRLDWVRWEIHPWYEESGRIGGIILFSEVVTERKRAEQALQTRLRLSQFADSHSLEELLQTALDEAEILTASTIGFAHFLQADQKTLELQAWSTNTLKNMCTAEGKGSHYSVDQAGVWVECVSTHAQVIHNDYASLPASRRKGLPQGHAPILRELIVPVLHNELIMMIMGVGNKSSDYDDRDVKSLSQLANSVWDIIQRKRAEEDVKRSEKKYRMLHESMMDGFVSVNMDGNILEYNEIFRYLLGYTKDEITQLTYKDITPEKWHAFENDIVENQILKNGYSEVYEKEYRRKDGVIFPVELHTVLLRDEQGNSVGMWASVRDITERKRAELELRYMKVGLESANKELKAALALQKELAHTDTLTGINNRRRLYELAEHEFDIAARYQQPLSAIMFDIDHFKDVNDTYGHAVGDQILQRVTEVACAKLRSADVIGRYGGEEFVIIMPMTNAKQAYPLAERIRTGVEAIRVTTEKGDATVTLSIGIVEMIHFAKNGSAEELIRRADEAMYAAKQAGRNRTEISD